MSMSVGTESLKVASGSGRFFEELRETQARIERTPTIIRNRRQILNRHRVVALENRCLKGNHEWHGECNKELTFMQSHITKTNGT